VLEFVISLLISEFRQKLLDKVHNLGKFALVDFLCRGSEFSEDTEDWLDKRRRS